MRRASEMNTEVIEKISGHHEVALFRLRDVMHLPPNWKPFAVTRIWFRRYAVCRKWHRA